MELSVTFRLSDEAQREEFEVALEQQRAVVAETTLSKHWTLYDSFDWRLFEQGLWLRRSENEWFLAPFAGGRSQRYDTGSRPIFAWDLPDSALRRMLEPILKARALLKLATVTVHEKTYRLLNSDEKTVARIDYVTISAGPDDPEPVAATYARLRPIRGYEGHVRRLAKTLAVGARVDSLGEAIFHDALATAAKLPGDYSSKLDVVLEPDQRSDEAAKVLLRRLLKTIHANENGIRDDIDIEFLHDYRVAIRRTRSALSQIRGVFPAETTDHFKQVFRALGTRTNYLRDMDVYLLAESDYQSMLPENLREDISPLFDLLRSQRASAFDYVIEGMDEAQYEQVLTDWQTFLDLPGMDDPTAPNASLPVIKLARKRIYKRYRRIVEDGTYILDHTEDELLHALRLECKKLRYLLEFFASLFPKKQSRRLIKQLKRLQENLGDFTDLSVQQESLMSMADQLPDNDPRTRRALIATGALVDTLARRQQAVKADFATTFTHFAASANQKEFADLFGPKKSKKKGKK